MRLWLVVLATIGALFAVPACGGSSSNAPSGGGSSTTPAQNVQPIIVDAGPANNAADEAFTAVTICTPGSTTDCQTIDGIVVDTGSSGLRILGSLLTLPLPKQTSSNGNAITECLPFLDGFTWGAVETADIKIAGEQASAVPIQAIGSSVSATIPAACTASGPVSEDTLDSLGANGILGIGVFRQDCGSECAFSTSPGLYYSCASTGCTPTVEALTQQVQNPVWRFPKDNNGVTIALSAVPSEGALSVTGSLVFGIGTESNNGLGNAKVLTVDVDSGYLTTVFNGQSYAGSFVDSGSNGLYFLDPATTGLPLCKDASDFYCPSTLQTLSATNRGANGVTIVTPLLVANLDSLNPQFSAFNDIAGPNPGSFDWGLAFFFGRTVFTAIEGQATPGGVGPYVAY